MAGDCELIILSGEIDMARQDELDAVVETYRRSPSPNVVLDVGGVTFFGSDGIRVLVKLCRIATSRGGDVTLLDADARVTRVLEICGLSDQVVLQDRDAGPAPDPVGL